MELKDIKAIIDLMKKNDLAVFKLEKEGIKIELEAHRPVHLVATQPAVQPLPVTGPVVAPPDRARRPRPRGAGTWRFDRGSRPENDT